MSRNKDQGTDWERHNLTEAHAHQIDAMYLRAMGINDMGDLWLNKPPSTLGPRVAVLAWKRLIDRGGGRRVPLGERDMYVVDHDTFWAMLQALLRVHPGLQVVMECKAAEALSASRALADAKQAAGHTGVWYSGLESN